MFLDFLRNDSLFYSNQCMDQYALINTQILCFLCNLYPCGHRMTILKVIRSQFTSFPSHQKSVKLVCNDFFGQNLTFFQIWTTVVPNHGFRCGFLRLFFIVHGFCFTIIKFLRNGDDSITKIFGINFGSTEKGLFWTYTTG